MKHEPKVGDWYLDKIDGDLWRVCAFMYEPGVSLYALVNISQPSNCTWEYLNKDISEIFANKDDDFEKIEASVKFVKR